MADVIDYQPKKRPNPQPPNLMRGLLGWVLFGGLLAVLWAFQGPPGHGVRWLLIVLASLAVIAVAFMVVAALFLRKVRWTVERHFRLRKAETDGPLVFRPAQFDEPLLRAARDATNREFGRLGFTDMFAHNSTVMEAFWMSAAGGTQYLLSPDGRTVVIAAYAMLRSRLLRRLLRQKPPVTTASSLCTLLEDGRWVITSQEQQGLTVRPRPSWILKSVVAAGDLQGLLAAHEQHVARANGAPHVFSSPEDIETAVIKMQTGMQAFDKSVGYVQVAEVWPVLTPMSAERRASELRTLKALRAAEGFDTVIPAE